MEKVSDLMRDQMESPLDRAVYWIEYVIRHKGAPHLRTASRKLFFFQRSLFDVFLFVVVCSGVVLFLVFRLFRHLVPSYSGGNKMNYQKKMN